MLAAGDSATIAIPADEVAARYAALVRVYNAPFPARDSVVEFYDIHTFGRPPAHDLMVGVEWTAAWKDAWQRGERLTGNAGIDALMETWDLKVWQYLELTVLPYDLTLLRSAAPLNTIGLAMRFRALEGVASASPDWLIGDGDDIRATRDSAAWVLAFSLGYGDCPAGCTGRTVWTFSVFDDGRVRYDGSKVSGLPGPIPVP